MRKQSVEDQSDLQRMEYLLKIIQEVKENMHTRHCKFHYRHKFLNNHNVQNGPLQELLQFSQRVFASSFFFYCVEASNRSSGAKDCSNTELFDRLKRETLSHQLQEMKEEKVVLEARLKQLQRSIPELEEVLSSNDLISNFDFEPI